MAKFRKKPVVVEAEQWFPGKHVEGVRRAMTALDPSDPTAGNIEADVIITLEGAMCVMPGDWIITDVAGEKYPCRDDIFRATYEAVE